MQIVLCLALALSLLAGGAYGQGLTKGTVLKLPVGIDLTVVDEEVKDKTHTYKAGEQCKSSRNTDSVEYVRGTTNSVTGIFKRGGTPNPGDKVCPSGTMVMFHRVLLDRIIREADEKFSRDMFLDKK